jgi:hypothetical protein
VLPAICNFAWLNHPRNEWQTLRKVLGNCCKDATRLDGASLPTDSGYALSFALRAKPLGNRNTISVLQARSPSGADNYLQLQIEWPGRFRPKQSWKERLSKAANGACCGTLRRLSHDRTTGTARGGAGNTVCRCSCNRVLTRIGITLGRRRFGPFHTIVDILLRNFGHDAK